MAFSSQDWIIGRVIWIHRWQWLNRVSIVWKNRWWNLYGIKETNRWIRQKEFIFWFKWCFLRQNMLAATKPNCKQHKPVIQCTCNVMFSSAKHIKDANVMHFNCITFARKKICSMSSISITIYSKLHFISSQERSYLPRMPSNPAILIILDKLQGISLSIVLSCQNSFSS